MDLKKFISDIPLRYPGLVLLALLGGLFLLWTWLTQGVQR